MHVKVRKLGNKSLRKSNVIIFFVIATKLSTSVAFQLKQLLSYFMHRMTLISSPSFYPLSAKLERVVIMASSNSVKFYPFEATKGIPACCACAVHMQMYIPFLAVIW